MNTLFRGGSLAERGTLSQLKNDFGHRNVTTDVMNSFNFVDNFLRCLNAHYYLEVCMHITKRLIPTVTEGTMHIVTTKPRTIVWLNISVQFLLKKQNAFSDL